MTEEMGTHFKEQCRNAEEPSSKIRSEHFQDVGIGNIEMDHQ